LCRPGHKHLLLQFVMPVHRKRETIQDIFWCYQSSSALSSIRPFYPSSVVILKELNIIVLWNQRSQAGYVVKAFLRDVRFGRFINSLTRRRDIGARISVGEVGSVAGPRAMLWCLPLQQWFPPPPPPPPPNASGPSYFRVVLSGQSRPNGKSRFWPMSDPLAGLSRPLVSVSFFTQCLSCLQLLFFTFKFRDGSLFCFLFGFWSKPNSQTSYHPKLCTFSSSSVPCYFPVRILQRFMLCSSLLGFGGSF